MKNYLEITEQNKIGGIIDNVNFVEIFAKLVI